jgi:nitrite reductase/ring-hydroxylating ferredoxin subunit
MATAKDTEILTRVGSSMPMGELMRQYWIPAAMSRELLADGVPMRLMLLGERLIAFRDSSGKIGVMDHRCPHRCASLFYGRNENGGIRCVYHGFKWPPRNLERGCPPPMAKGGTAVVGVNNRSYRAKKTAHDVSEGRPPMGRLLIIHRCGALRAANPLHQNRIHLVLPLRQIRATQGRPQRRREVEAAGRSERSCTPVSWARSPDVLAPPARTISDAEPSGHIDDGGDTLGSDQVMQRDSRWRRSQFEKPYRHSFLGKVRQLEKI